MERRSVLLRTAAGISLAILTLCSSAGTAAGQDRVPTGIAAFERMRDYLAAEGGRWRAPNPSHDPSNGRSPDAFGLWFEVSAQGRVLELTVVNHFGSEVRKGSTSYWFWHPGDRRILYHEIRTSGGVRMGRTDFEGPHTFVTLTEAVSATGDDNTLNRGRNVIVSDTVHATVAFTLGERGEWTEQQALTWTRTRPSG